MRFKKYILFILLISFSFPQLLDKIDSNALKSLILPGWGQKSINENNHSRNFFISEACLWLSFLGSNHANKSYMDNYISFGSYHAGINLNNIDDSELSLLIVHMSQYDNMDIYNETMDRQRSDRSYSDASIYGWDWDTNNNRNTFNSLRMKSATAEKINNFTISALIINRLISFFDVIYLSDKKYKIKSSVSSDLNNNLLLNCSIHF